MFSVISEERWQTTLRTRRVGLITWINQAIARVTAMVPLVIEEQRPDGTWTRSEAAVPNALLRKVRNSAGSQSGLVKSMTLAYQGPGECFGAMWDAKDVGIVYDIFQFPAIDFRKSAGTVHIRRRENARLQDGPPAYLVLPAKQVERLWVPDEEWPDEAWSPWKDLVPDITRYASAVEAIGLGVDSRLLTNGILWAPEDSIKPGPDGATDWITDYMKIAQKSFTGPKGKMVAARVPFPIASKVPPQFIDVGQGVVEHLLDSERRLLEGIARCSPLPMQLVIEGPGTGNHWSDALLERSYLKFEIDPLMEQITGDLTAWALRPRLGMLRDSKFFEGDPAKYRIGYDLTDVANKDDNVDQMTTAYADGIIRRIEVAQALGMGEDELLELPAGVTEYEHWLAVRTSKNADSKLGDEAPGSPFKTPETPETIDEIPTDPSVPVPEMPAPSPTLGAFEAELERWANDNLLCPDGNCG